MHEAEGERQHGLQPDNAERGEIHRYALGFGIVRCVVGCNRINRAIGQAFDEGDAIGFGTQRWIHFTEGAVFHHGFVGEDEMVWRYFGGDVNAFFLRPAH